MMRALLNKHPSSKAAVAKSANVCDVNDCSAGRVFKHIHGCLLTPTANAIVRTISLTVIIVTLTQSVNAQDFEAFEPPGLLPTTGAMSALARAGQPEWQFGFQLFHLLLEQKGLYSVEDFRESMDRRPRQTAVVLVGNFNKVPFRLRSRLADFIDDGGTVLIASDETAFLSGHFLIDEGPFEAQAGQVAYQGFRDCPVINDLHSGSRILDGVSQLIANRSGAITKLDNHFGNWTTLARLPKSTTPSRSYDWELPLIAEMKSRRKGGGRLMVMADHSILINGMLWHGDNAKLAVNLADWLSEGDRKEVVFIVDGQPIKAMLATPHEFPDELPPLDDLPTPTLKDIARLPKDVLLDFSNRFVAGMEDADVLNELLANQPAELPTSKYRQALYIAAGILATIYMLRLMGRTGHRVPAAPPRAVGDFVGQSRAPVLSSNEIQRAGRELAQSALRQLTGSPDPLDWTIPINDVAIDAGLLHRLSVRNSLKQLKMQASSTSRSILSPQDLRRLAAQSAAVLKLKAEGRLRLPSIPD